METLSCACCGAPVETDEGQELVKCGYCGSLNSIPKSIKKRRNMYEKANELRMQMEFAAAINAYEKILYLEEKEPEAYWGIVLSRYGIEYVKDAHTGEMIPTCHKAAYTSFLEDKDYKKALEYASPEKRLLWQKEGQKIDSILQNVLRAAGNEEPYDVFICYKETDEHKKRTKDSVYAREIYDALTREGFRVFYAPKSIDLGLGYEPAIFSALHSAKLMFVIGTRPEYFDAVWVKNEWSRYLELIQKEENKVLIPVFQGIKPEKDLPEELRSFQAYNLDTLGYIHDLTDVAYKITGRQRAAQSSSGPQTDVREYVIRGNEAIKKQDWDLAREYFIAASELIPGESEAWWGMLRISTGDFAVDLREPLLNEEEQKLYEKALKCADSRKKQIYEERIRQYKEDVSECFRKKYEDELRQTYAEECKMKNGPKYHWSKSTGTHKYERWLNEYRDISDKILKYAPDIEKPKIERRKEQMLQYRKEYYGLVEKYGMNYSDPETVRMRSLKGEVERLLEFRPRMDFCGKHMKWCIINFALLAVMYLMFRNSQRGVDDLRMIGGIVCLALSEGLEISTYHSESWKMGTVLGIGILLLSVIVNPVSYLRAGQWQLKGESTDFLYAGIILTAIAAVAFLRSVCAYAGLRSKFGKAKELQKEEDELRAGMRKRAEQDLTRLEQSYIDVEAYFLDRNYILKNI